jgi:hypothetical protein
MTGTYSLIFKQIRLDSYVKLTSKNSSLPLMKEIGLIKIGESSSLNHVMMNYLS